jgi:hypothetical protein
MQVCPCTSRIIMTATEGSGIATSVLGASVQSPRSEPLLASPVATERDQRIRNTRSVPVGTVEGGEEGGLHQAWVNVSLMQATPHRSVTGALTFVFSGTRARMS